MSLAGLSITVQRNQLKLKDMDWLFTKRVYADQV